MRDRQWESVPSCHSGIWQRSRAPRRLRESITVRKIQRLFALTEAFCIFSSDPTFKPQLAQRWISEVKLILPGHWRTHSAGPTRANVTTIVAPCIGNFASIRINKYLPDGGSQHRERISEEMTLDEIEQVLYRDSEHGDPKTTEAQRAVRTF
jgi:hypothetical protein